MSATSSHSSSIQSMSTPEASSVVKLKGLPFKAQPADVLEFFTGFDIKEENIYLKRHPDGRPNGEVSQTWVSLPNSPIATLIAMLIILGPQLGKKGESANCLTSFRLTLLIPHVQAFIVFDSASESRRACQKDRETFLEKFGDRYVRVYPTLDSDLADMQAAMTQQTAQQVNPFFMAMCSDGS